MTQNDPHHEYEENPSGDSPKSFSAMGSGSDGSLGSMRIRELPEVLTLREVAQVLRCSKAHVCKIVNGRVAGTPRIPTIALGRRKLVRRATLLCWLSDNEQSARMASSPEVDAGGRA